MNDFKKKVKDKIKTYSKKEYLDGYIKNEFLLEDNYADIFLNLSSVDELLDSRTIGDQLDINESIFKYIDDKTSMLENDIKIRLHIIGLNLDSKNQGIVKHIIKEHYAIELYKIQKNYNYYKRKILFLTLFGIFSVLLYLFLYLRTDFLFILEVLGFLFSFSLWEAFDCIIYTFSDIKNEREAACQNLLIDVVFDELL